MRIQEMSEPIDIEKSSADSRSLIMPHQKEAVDAMTEYFQLDSNIPNRNGIVVMPTGSGKTYTSVTWLLSEGVAKGYRIVWLVHRQELVEQTYQEFRNQAPILKGTGVKKLRVLPVSGAHLKMVMATKADVYVCSVASVANKYGYRFIERMVGAAGKRKLIIVVDEAHHSVAANYQKVIRRMTKLNPNRVLLGLTATPTRMQKSEQSRLQQMFNINENLVSGKGKNGYVYEITLKQLILSGFLANPIYERVKTNIVGEVEFHFSSEDESYFMQYGELSEKIKNQIAKSSARNKLILQQYLEHKEKYGKTIIFAENQLHAETLCGEFQSAGIPCDFAVSGRSDAQEVIKRFKRNEFDVLINVQILTEGSDIPDIHTVFLTRHTNSDSLLRQMIGRGLRGEKAGGTKDAHIVAFHDTWNSFVSFLDPGTLDIFEPEEDETEDIGACTEVVEITPNEEMLELLKRLGADVEASEDDISQMENEQSVSTRDLYLKLYQLMKASLVMENETPIYPCGWYSVIDEDGNEIQMLVFDSQENTYKEIENNIGLIKDKINVDQLLQIYFNENEILPDIQEMDYFLDYINETGMMPPYFTFEQRQALEPKEIADKVNSLFEKEEEKEAWLKELYDSAPVLQQIYRYFYAFKKTVFDAMKIRTDAEIQTIDERKKYEIIDNCYNLSELLREVKDMYPLLRTDGLVRIGWSKSVVRNWFALCQRFVEEDELLYQIHVNKILSSPKVDREVIKYLIFHELLHQNGYWNHDEEFRKREWQYPNSAELDGFLDNLALEYDMDDIYKDSVYYEEPELQRDEEENPPETTENDHIKELSQHSETSPIKGIIEGFKYCRNCGNRLPKTARFCDKCGEKLNY